MLLEQETRHQLLLVKELQQKEQQLRHRQEELNPSSLPQLTSSPPPFPIEESPPVPLSPLVQEFLSRTSVVDSTPPK